MLANVVITGAKISPNPVLVGGQFILSVSIVDRLYVLESGENTALVDADGVAIRVE